MNRIMWPLILGLLYFTKFIHLVSWISALYFLGLNIIPLYELHHILVFIHQLVNRCVVSTLWLIVLVPTHLHLVLLNLRQGHTSPLGLILALGFLRYGLSGLRKSPSISSLLNAFIVKRCWILSNAFFASIKTTIWFLSFINMMCYIGWFSYVEHYDIL